jgi:hypothetical protein
MEFVIVQFPTQRQVNVNGGPQGTTGKIIRLQAGTHRFDLGSPVNYKPTTQTVQVTGTTKSTPLPVVFTPRIAAAAAARKRSRKKTRARKTPRPAAATRAAAPANADTQSITVTTPTRTVTLAGADGAQLEKRRLQQEAMRWTYVLRNRERWAALPVTAKQHGQRSRELLVKLGLSDADLLAIANDRAVEVAIPYTTENDGWEARIFPWEYMIAAATREVRRGEPVTVMRRLVVPGRLPAERIPLKVLFVESAPGRLNKQYSFETERSLVRGHLRAKEWEDLKTPTLDQLEATISRYRPDIIHLAGFDSHQGLRLVRPLENTQRGGEETPPATERESESTADGYLMAGLDGEPVAVDASTLARVLCTDGHRPRLVSFSLHNSAARVAAMAVAHGAQAAIGFQDVVDDELAELFFGAFYRAWRKQNWDLARGFETAWQVVRASAAMLGSGIVLWSARSLLGAATRRALTAPSADLVPPAQLLPAQVPPEDAGRILSAKIEPFEELNYSVLHNRCELFDVFTLVNSSAEYKEDELRTVADVNISVTLNAGPESASYARTLSVSGPTLDLKDKIHVPLTSELMRSVHETINSSLLVEVAWGKVLHRDSYRVRLLPVDQWRDNDRDGLWLPSFVLPRDPAVGSIIDKAQRYVRVLRDNPSSGFDGYQSVDSNAPDPTAEVDRQVQAIWSTIVHELSLGYINPPPSYNNAMDSQRLRTPSMIVQDRMGTCIDLALLFAACCELIDVYPVLFLLKDHAFPGYWRNADYQQKFIEVADGFVPDIASDQAHKTDAPGVQRVAWWFRDTAYAEIKRQVDLGHLVPLESVWLTEHTGFADAIEGGRDNLKKPRRFHSMLDIARAREARVTPLPLGNHV